VTTDPNVEDKTDSTGTLQASFVYGNAVPSFVGFKWGLEADLSDAMDSTIAIGADSTIQMILNGLQVDSTYYFTGYATNAGGTAYGDTLSFVARTFVCESPTFDGHDYDVVVIGDQCWFAENLRTENYNDGTAIPNETDDSTWEWLTTGAQCSYQNNDSNIATYGRLYNGYAVNTGKLCPTGWHVPTDAEWTALTDTLGGLSVAGDALKSSESDSPDWDGTNSSGFSALDGGWRLDGPSPFLSEGSNGYFWSSSPQGTNQLWYRKLSSGSSEVGKLSNNPFFGLSVRCLRDSSSAPVVTTTQIDALNASEANLKGNVAFNWEPTTSTGLTWGYASDLSDGTAIVGDTLDGDFSAVLSGLNAETAVYYAAFASNSLGTAYGDTLTFTTKTGLTDANIHAAVDVWCADSQSAETTYGHISDWDVSAVTDMYQLFKEKTTFNDDISDWDVSAVTATAEMFWMASAFNQDLSAWDVRSFENMRSMFFNASNFTSDLSSWDVSLVTNMFGAFQGATMFNSNLNQWNVGSVLDMKQLFQNCPNFNSDLSQWDVRNVTTMASMFYGASSFSNDLNSWDMNGVQNTASMFTDATSFNGNISSWDVSTVTTMKNMFQNATSFNQPIGNWNVGQVKFMNSMFSGATSFDQNLNIWNVGAVREMDYMFSKINFNQNLSGWDVSEVTSMTGMFSKNTTFNQDIGGWDVGSVTDMGALFADATSFNQNLPLWDVSGVTSMASMFRNASSFNGNISNWIVESVTAMNSMFEGCSAFNGDLSLWNVASVKNLSMMFKDASAFNQNIGNWDVSDVTDFNRMFNEASSFNQDLSSWTLLSAKNTGMMFAYATSFDQGLASWDVSTVEEFSNMFQGASVFNQDLSSWDVSSATQMRYFGSNAGFSDDHYDAMLESWSNLPLQPNVQLDMQAGYCYGAGARQFIIDQFNWQIGDGAVCIPTPAVTTDAASNVDQTSADIAATFENMSTVADAGFTVSVDSTLAGATNQSAGTTSPFNLALTGLTPNTTYYYRAYATDEIGTIKGGIQSFQTFGLPQVNTIADTAWTDTTATLTGVIPLDVLPAITATGFKWGTQSDLSDATDVSGSALTDTFTYALTASGPLYYSAYATNSIATTYGDTIELSSAPTVATDAPVLSSATTVVLNGRIEKQGRSAITATGFTWGYSADLNDGTQVTGSALTGEFNANVSGLPEGVTLYVSTFATNGLGTSHGDTLSIETPAVFNACGSEIGFDGYNYATVLIGNQCWFAENLRNENYNDGTPIQSGPDATMWQNTNDGAVTIYGEGGADEAANLAGYGRLYNWHAVNTGNLCPSGWHVPSQEELLTLTDWLGGKYAAGYELKASASDTPAWNGVNTSGFSGLPGGQIYSGEFGYLGTVGVYWSSTPVGTNDAWARKLFNLDSKFWESNLSRQGGFSVRCILTSMVETISAQDIGFETGTLQGKVNHDGGSNLVATGFKWGLEADLSDATDVATTMAADSTFAAALTGLEGSTTYYFSAYATNAAGTVFGDTLSFTTSCNPFPSTLQGCDAGALTSLTYQGYDYQLVDIDGECWFAENLRSENYNDDTAIPSGLDGATWGSTTDGAVTFYLEGGAFAALAASNLSQNGRLYNWYAVETGNLCPTGWHVPTDAEFTALTDYLGGASLAGDKMKSASCWDGDNASGFSALAGGGRNNYGGFINGGLYMYFWSSSPYVTGTSAYARQLDSENTEVYRLFVNERNGYSVRCVRDE